MKKKTKLIISIVAGVVAFIVFWAVGFTLVTGRVEYSKYKGYVNIAWEYVEDDDYFSEKYGEPEAFEYIKNSRIKAVDGERQVTFIVITETGQKYKVTAEVIRSAADNHEKVSYVDIKKE